MPRNLLTTKLFLPQLRPNLVRRNRLVDRVNDGMMGRLTLLSAPAGFGKTTLLSEWSRSVNRPVAWLSLDEADNELPRFLTYFLGALQTLAPHLGQGTAAALQSPGTVEIDLLLTDLLNEMAALEPPTVLILDDYHLIESVAVDQAVIFLIEHLPPNIHLIIASRIDPSFPLARWRVGGQMTELRADDLRFTTAEAGTFLKVGMGIPLSTPQLISLKTRTEGWIAGLQLAALSLQGLNHRWQIEEFIQRFTGSNRYIQDYLTDEVLKLQLPDTLAFLLQTSILDRLSGALCDAVTNRQDSQQILTRLETNNLFLVPLDNERHWYRYHPLFADLLTHRLKMATPDIIPGLHQRASAWLEGQDDIEAALRHAQAAGDSARVAAILEHRWQVVVHRGELFRLQQMLDSLGPDYTKQSAPLSMAYCWIYALTEAADKIPPHLHDTRAALGQYGGSEGGVMPDNLAVLPSLAETMEAIIALDSDQPEAAKTHAIRAITIIPPYIGPANQGLLQGAAAYRLAEAHRKLGEIEEACTVLLTGLESLKASSNYLGAAATVMEIASMYQEIGQTEAALTVCEEMLAFVSIQGWGDLRPIGLVYVKYADVLADRGEIEAAADNLKIGRDLLRVIKTRHSTGLVDQVTKKIDQATTVSQPLIEPLSPRELEVVKLLAEGLSNKAIGERLFLALDTVKGHNRNIYGKLGVNNRTQAVNKAIALNLISPSK